jgi:hypothetical protein
MKKRNKINKVLPFHFNVTTARDEAKISSQYYNQLGINYSLKHTSQLDEHIEQYYIKIQCYY